MTSNASDRTRLARGFTLFELLVVLVLFSLAAGLVAARFASQPPGPAEVARETVHVLRSARATAMRDGHETRVTFDMPARALVRDGLVVKTWPEAIGVNVTAAQSESGGGSFSVRFLPDGGSTGLSADFEQEGEDTSRVTVSWLTGEVRDVAR